jgi:hypothetical protein
MSITATWGGAWYWTAAPTKLKGKVVGDVHANNLAFEIAERVQLGRWVV